MNVTTKDANGLRMRERLDEALREGHESYMKLMEELFEGVGWLTQDVLSGMRETDDFYCSLFAQVRSPKLSNGRVVLLGDAGYATPGMGTSLAIMGGYVLAGELMNHPEDFSLSLKRYEELLQPFVKSQQGGEGAMQFFLPQTQWGIAIRNALFRFVFALRIDR